jgi:uncharacterized protein (TIGR02302 family)
MLALALFLALAAFDLLPRLPGWLHLTILIGFLGAIIAAVAFELKRNRRPTRSDVLRRIELDNQLSHRPFSTLIDQPFAGKPAGSELWRTHQLRAAQAISRIRLIKLRPFVAGLDRHAGRALVGLLLLIGIIVSSNRFGERLDAALSPAVFGNMAARNVGLDVWITPPDYTGAPPVILSRSQASNETIEVPVESKVEARVNGGWSLPRLHINGSKLAFEKTAPHSYQITTDLLSGDRLAVTQGWHRLGSWPLSILPNVAPVIAWINPPAAGDHSSVKLEYTAADQYGLAKIEARIRLADAVKGQMLPKGTALDQPGADIFTVELPGQAGHPKSVKAAPEEDWTGNPWAGFPVEVQLTATNLAGQTAVTTEEELILPERAFTQPVAKAIIALRKRLTLDPLGERVDIAGKVAELGSHYDDYGGDATIFLALQIAASRLRHDEQLADLRDIQDMLWQAAVQIEDGATSQSAKNLSAAEKALQDALDRHAPQSEIDKLTGDLKNALNKHLDQLEKELAKRLAQGEAIPLAPPGSQALTRNSLNDLVDKMQNAARNGDSKSAQQMLSQLEDEMKNLHARQNQPPSSKSQQAMKDMGKLKDLIQRQQQLMDKTFRRSTGNTAPDEEMHSYHHNPFDPRHRQLGDAEDNGAESQRHLKSDLQGLQHELEGLGMKAPKMGEASTAMGNAIGQLDQNHFAQALPSQQEALDKLKDDMQSLSQQMQQEGGGMAMGNGGSGNGGGKDPLGRPTGGSGSDEKVDIPDSSDQERARAVIEELRKRSGERNRAKTEHDYIDRLLKGF